MPYTAADGDAGCSIGDEGSYLAGIRHGSCHDQPPANVQRKERLARMRMAF